MKHGDSQTEIHLKYEGVNEEQGWSILFVSRSLCSVKKCFTIASYIGSFYKRMIGMI